MGITIFARGSIDKTDDIPVLIAEIKEVAGKKGWNYEVIDDDFDQLSQVELEHNKEDSSLNINGSLGLKGILIDVGPGVDTLALLFDRSGVLTDVMSQVVWLQDKGRDDRLSICKTQFGSIEGHISIIEILDILKDKYMTNLEVTDEGDYWTSRDRELLSEKRAVLEHYINHAKEAISNAKRPAAPDQSLEDLALSIERSLLDAEGNKGPIQ
ncbi:MAG: hypothetical protein K9K64_08840 [Desulfohalobiaceae bacterium]|nr:hypothetical protein [Desulfohalobiaceae bacterium]